MSQVTVRYIVNDVDEAISFYTEKLDFKVEIHPAPSFASLTRGNLRLALSVPSKEGGSGPAMPDGMKPEPGGRNRFHLKVDDLAATVAKLKKEGAHFRNEIVEGKGGKQILLEDPSGNPIELFKSY